MRLLNGHVYRMSSHFDPSGEVSPEAILGAWKVDATGQATGTFILNPNYDPDLRP
ncbi:MAG: hypothetical protein AAF222_05455 [Pseudomonadota bacterium]